MDWLRIYFDFTEGLFCFFTLEFLTPLGNKDYNATKKIPLRICYLIISTIWAIPANIPFSTPLDLLLNFLYIYLISNHNLKSSILQFLKYEIYGISSTFIVFPLLCIAADDFSLVADNDLYYNYKSLICSAITYVILCLFVYSKRLAAFHNKKHYGIGFCISISFAIFILNYLCLILISGRFNTASVLPVIFSLIFIIIAICLTGYDHILLSLEENARQQVLISKYELENTYYQNLKDSMDSFRALRHDFKNHLIILNGYAAQNDYEKLQAYLHKINNNMTDMQVIQTPHDLTSAILNAKSLLCRQKNISFHHNCKFSTICISDFHLITILGNVLDNAITAAGKLEDGAISFTMEQTNSYLSIVCQNNHAEKIVEKNGRFLSTKENPGIFHGLGIKNIQDSVNALNGILDIQYDEFTFKVSILLPNYN